MGRPHSLGRPSQNPEVATSFFTGSTVHTKALKSYSAPLKVLWSTAATNPYASTTGALTSVIYGVQSWKQVVCTVTTTVTTHCGGTGKPPCRSCTQTKKALAKKVCTPIMDHTTAALMGAKFKPYTTCTSIPSGILTTIASMQLQWNFAPSQPTVSYCCVDLASAPSWLLGGNTRADEIATAVLPLV